ncbi:hypothetical protein Q3G72_032482 [Acer saccharum]|nr:hypothetical protein Q3G72_032482 [Acer saccharum]
MIVVVGLIILFFVYLHIKFNNRPQGQHGRHRRNNEIPNHRHRWQSTPSARPSAHPRPSSEADNFSTRAFDGSDSLQYKPSKPVSRPSAHARQSSEEDNFSTRAFDGSDSLQYKPHKPVSRPSAHARQSSEADNFSTRAFDGSDSSLRYKPR